MGGRLIENSHMNDESESGLPACLPAVARCHQEIVLDSATARDG